MREPTFQEMIDRGSVVLDDENSRPTEPKTCLWSDQSDYDMEGTYDTSCGEMWAFTQDGLKENGITYCPFCGGVIYETCDEVKK